MQTCSTTQSLCQTIGMRQLTGQCDGLLTPLQSLIRVAQYIQELREAMQAIHPRIKHKASGVGHVQPVEGQARLKLGAGLDELPHEKEGTAQRIVSPQEAERILPSLGQVHELLGQGIGRLE